MFATARGQVKKTAFTEYDKSRREGFIAINLRDGDELVRVVATSGDDDLFVVTRKGMTIRFSENDVRAMGRDAAGVRGIRLREEDEVVSLDVARDEADILMVTDAGYGKRTKLERFNRQARGGQGVRGIRLTAKRGRVVAAFMVALDEEILLVSTGGVVIRMAVREIASQGRDATGVRVMNLDDGPVGGRGGRRLGLRVGRRGSSVGVWPPRPAVTHPSGSGHRFECHVEGGGGREVEADRLAAH